MAFARSGVHRALEDEANRLIRESLVGVTRHSEKADILTPWKEAERYRREVYVASGSPDQAIRKGMFHRVASTSSHMNSQEGISRTRRGGIAGALTDFVDEHSVTQI